MGPQLLKAGYLTWVAKSKIWLDFLWDGEEEAGAHCPAQLCSCCVGELRSNHRAQFQGEWLSLQVALPSACSELMWVKRKETASASFPQKGQKAGCIAFQKYVLLYVF